jgi:hypothetical protein
MDLMQRIIDQYLKSGDFNGLYLGVESLEDIEEAKKLVKAGQVQVVSEEDYINPHIRPWPSRRSVEQQLGSLDAMSEDRYGLCLYPTPLALRSVRTPRRLAGQPYQQAMAKGRGTLELAYFRFDVLEAYRNDPRFRFAYYDFGAQAVTSDEVYGDADEPDADRIVIENIGFAYDLSEYDPHDPQSPIIRRVCAFYGDLWRLSSLHQQRWKTYEVDGAGLKPHPVWWSQQMGHWPDGLGPFERLFFELKSVNELHERAFGVPLLRFTERPTSIGWILRPSSEEFDRFVHDLDKLLSENLRPEAFDVHNISRTDDHSRNIGTLNRLDRFLERHKMPTDIRSELMAPLKEIRKARQKPAHAFSRNVNDQSFIHRQADLVERVTDSLELLRRFLQTHSANKAWSEPSYLKGRNYRL